MKHRLVAMFVASLALAGLAQAADTYTVDTAHTTVGFSVSHMVLSDVTGKFTDFKGTLTIDPAKGNALVGAQATIEAKSIDTSNAKRDDHLRSADFFDVAKYPTITFESTGIETEGVKTFLAGKFTMKGVTKEIKLPVTLKGPIKDPWGATRLGFSTEIKINRKDYGLTWSKTLETGGLVVGDEVHITINGEFTKVQPDQK